MADVMADDNVVDELTTDAAVDDVVFLDFVADIDHDDSCSSKIT